MGELQKANALAFQSLVAFQHTKFLVHFVPFHLFRTFNSRYSSLCVDIYSAKRRGRETLALLKLIKWLHEQTSALQHVAGSELEDFELEHWDKQLRLPVTDTCALSVKLEKWVTTQLICMKDCIKICPVHFLFWKNRKNNCDAIMHSFKTFKTIHCNNTRSAQRLL